MRGSKYVDITLAARQRVMGGARPEHAWIETLKERYSGEMLSNQVQHSCPKWAFSILCHEGHVRGVAPGSCPAAEGKRSAEFTLRALDLMRSEPSLAKNKSELKRRVFGERGSPGYRKPNDEVEVLLAFWEAGLVHNSSALL